MLSVAKLTPGQERYYERSVAAGLDDYYAGRGESPGRLDRPRRPGARARRRRARGRARAADPRPPPAHRKQLLARVTARARVITIERIDPLTDERASRPRSSRPSPVSTSSSRRRRASACSTRSATRRPAAPSTRRTCPRGRRRSPTSRTRHASSRRGAQGVHREHAAGFVAAAYQHRTSRAQDPHLHTHVIVANMAQTPERREVARTRRRGDPARPTGSLPATSTRRTCAPSSPARSASSGSRRARAWPSCVHVPREVIREFSTRRAQVVEQLATAGTSGFYAAQVAALETRDRKEHVDLVALREDWRARAAEHGLGERELHALLGRVRTPRAAPATSCFNSLARMLGPTRADREADRVLRPRGRDGVGRGARAGRVRRPRAPARGAAHADGRRRARRRGSEPGSPGPLLDRRARGRRAAPRLRSSSAAARPTRRRSASSVSTRSSVPTGSFSPTSRRRWSAKS